MKLVEKKNLTLNMQKAVTIRGLGRHDLLLFANTDYVCVVLFAEPQQCMQLKIKKME